VDEKPSIQALSRTTGYVRMSSGKIVRGLKSAYRRNGTLNLFAALERRDWRGDQEDDQDEHQDGLQGQFGREVPGPAALGQWRQRIPPARVMTNDAVSRRLRA